MEPLRVVALDDSASATCARLARDIEASQDPGEHASCCVLVAGNLDDATLLARVERELQRASAHARSRTLVIHRNHGASALRALLTAGVGDLVNEADDPPAAIRARRARWAQIDTSVARPVVAEHLVGTGEPWMCTLRCVAETALFSPAPLLLTGPTGTGKELLARVLHTLDTRPRKRELMTVDCTTLSRELAGSELFGHERGAFTGATSERDGAVARADGGTLFLDEVGELPLELQAQLLRVLQERAYRRVGGTTWHRAEFRLVCATNRDLPSEVAAGRFRRDLYHRIAAITCRTPALAERRTDIPQLVLHFAAREGASGVTFCPLLMDYLAARQYPGNVRELRQLVLSCLRRHVGTTPVSLACLPEEEIHLWRTVTPEASVQPSWHAACIDDFVRTALQANVRLKELGRLVEAAAVRIALAESDSVTAAAHWLGVTPRALHQRRAAQREEARH